MGAVTTQIFTIKPDSIAVCINGYYITTHYDNPIIQNDLNHITTPKSYIPALSPLPSIATKTRGRQTIRRTHHTRYLRRLALEASEDQESYTPDSPDEYEASDNELPQIVTDSDYSTTTTTTSTGSTTHTHTPTNKGREYHNINNHIDTSNIDDNLNTSRPESTSTSYTTTPTHTNSNHRTSIYKKQNNKDRTYNSKIGCSASSFSFATLPRAPTVQPLVASIRRTLPTHINTMKTNGKYLYSIYKKALNNQLARNSSTSTNTTSSTSTASTTQPDTTPTNFTTPTNISQTGCFTSGLSLTPPTLAPATLDAPSHATTNHLTPTHTTHTTQETPTQVTPTHITTTQLDTTDHGTHSNHTGPSISDTNSNTPSQVTSTHTTDTQLDTTNLSLSPSLRPDCTSQNTPISPNTTTPVNNNQSTNHRTEDSYIQQVNYCLDAEIRFFKGDLKDRKPIKSIDPKDTCEDIIIMIIPNNNNKTTNQDIENAYSELLKNEDVKPLIKCVGTIEANNIVNDFYNNSSTFKNRSTAWNNPKQTPHIRDDVRTDLLSKLRKKASTALTKLNNKNDKWIELHKNINNHAIIEGQNNKTFVTSNAQLIKLLTAPKPPKTKLLNSSNLAFYKAENLAAIQHDIDEAKIEYDNEIQKYITEFENNIIKSIRYITHNINHLTNDNDDINRRLMNHSTRKIKHRNMKRILEFTLDCMDNYMDNQTIVHNTLLEVRAQVNINITNEKLVAEKINWLATLKDRSTNPGDIKDRQQLAATTSTTKNDNPSKEVGGQPTTKSKTNLTQTNTTQQKRSVVVTGRKHSNTSQITVLNTTITNPGKPKK